MNVNCCYARLELSSAMRPLCTAVTRHWSRSFVAAPWGRPWRSCSSAWMASSARMNVSAVNIASSGSSLPQWSAAIAAARLNLLPRVHANRFGWCIQGGSLKEPWHHESERRTRRSGLPSPHRAVHSAASPTYRSLRPPQVHIPHEGRLHPCRLRAVTLTPAGFTP